MDGAPTGVEETARMNVVVEDVGPCKKKLKIDVPPEKVAEAVEKSYAELTQTVALPGFRRGHVPRKLLEKRFGKKIEEDLKESLIHDTFQEAVEENKLEPIGRAEFENIEFDPKGSLRYEVALSVRPAFELPEYKGLRIQRTPIKVSEKDVDEALERARREQAEVLDLEAGAKAEIGDLVEAALEFVVDGETVHTAPRAGLRLAAEGRIVPGIDTPGLAGKLIGVEAGAAVETEATLPDDFMIEAARGKGATVKIRANAIKRIRIPEATEAWAKEMGFDSLDAIRDEIRQSLFRDGEQAEERRIEEGLIDRVLDQLDIQLPEDLVKKEIDDILIRRRLRLKYMGRSDEEVAAELERIQGESRGHVERQLKQFFVGDKIAHKEKIFATEDDVDEHIARMAQRSGQGVDEVRSQIERSEALPQLRAEIRQDKVLKFLRENAEIVGEAI